MWGRIWCGTRMGGGAESELHKIQVRSTIMSETDIIWFTLLNHNEVTDPQKTKLWRRRCDILSSPPASRSLSLLSLSFSFVVIFQRLVSQVWHLILPPALKAEEWVPSHCKTHSEMDLSPTHHRKTRTTIKVDMGAKLSRASSPPCPSHMEEATEKGCTGLQQKEDCPTWGQQAERGGTANRNTSVLFTN